MVEQRAYNLRPRNDDSVTTQRRSEFARLREQRTQRRIQRKEAEAEAEEKRLREYFERASKRIKEIIDKIPKQKEDDMENRSKCVTFHINHLSFLS